MFLLRLKYIIPLALVSGLLASYGVYSYLQQQQERIKAPKIVTRQVVVTAVDLPAGTALKLNDLLIRQWPENLVPAGSFQEVKDLDGRVIKTDAIAGEAILAAKLAPPGSSGGVSSLIPPGMRAMAVAVNVVSGVGGFILPQTRVDVLATVAPSSKKEETSTKMILQNIQVLAVDQTYKKNDEDPVTVKSVTLLVSPEEAEKLALAGDEGKLHLMLRNSADPELRSTAGAQLSQLLGRPEAEPRKRITSPRPAPRVEVAVSPPETVEEPSSPKVVEVIRANVRSEINFEEGAGSNGKAKSSKEKFPKQ